MEQRATSTGRPETLLARGVVEPHAIPPSTRGVTHAKLVASRRC
jgi:hypothetical protein